MDTEIVWFKNKLLMSCYKCEVILTYVSSFSPPLNYNRFISHCKMKSGKLENELDGVWSRGRNSSYRNCKRKDPDAECRRIIKVNLSDKKPRSKLLLIKPVTLWIWFCNDCKCSEIDVRYRKLVLYLCR